MAKNQYLSDEESPQVYYQNRWVNRKDFRAFVYTADQKKLANSYKEYCDLIESGIWFSSQEEVEPKQPINIKSGRKSKNGANG